MPALATEAELQDLRREVREAEAERDKLRADADKLVGEIRDSGTEPLKDQDAFDKVDEAYKLSDAKAQEAVELRERADRVMEILGKKTSARPPTDNEAPQGVSRWIDAFIESETYARVRELAQTDGRAAAAHLRNNPVAVGTVDETIARLRDVTFPSSPSAVIPADMRRPPVLGLFEDTRILNLISTFPTDSDTVEYVVETLKAHAVAETAYGTALPESDFEFAIKRETLKRIGHYTKVTDAQLADASFLRAFLNQRLVEDVRRFTEARVVAGDSNGPGDQWNGILNTSGINTVTKGQQGDVHSLDTIHRGITQCRLAHVEPNGVALHPLNYERDVVLAKNEDNDYLFKIGEPTSVWGKPAAVTTAAPNGTGLVGDFSQAVLVVRSPIQVLASTEDQDNFLKGLVSIKAEYRAGFFVTRPAAFCAIEGLTEAGS